MAGYRESPYDTLAVRVEQARGVVAALLGLYDDKSRGFSLDAEYMHMALYAADELLEQANTALHADIDARLAKRGL